MTLVFSFVLALAVSALLVPICRVLAARVGHVGKDDRLLETRVRPLAGGMAIALTLFICATALGAVPAVPVLATCSAALLLFGLVSDRRHLRPSTKVVAQIAIACVFLAFDFRLYWADSLILDSVMTVFWVVGLTSAFDLLDTMDGLCAGIALIGGTAFLLTIPPIAEPGLLFAKAQYLAVLLGAIGGFLIYGTHPASVGLGDSGSLFIGLNMAAMTLQVARGRGSDLVSIVAVPLLVLLIPILDAALVGILRLLSGPADGTGREHSSQRLVAIGLSERAAVGVWWALAATSGFMAVVAGRAGQSSIAALAGAMFTIGMALFAVYLGRVRVHENAEPGAVQGAISPLGTAGGYWRRLAEVLLDLLLVSVAYNGAYRLRFDTPADYAAHFDTFLQSYPIVLGLQMVTLFAVGAYRGMWRYFSLSDGVTSLVAVVVGVVTSQAAVFYFFGFGRFSTAIFAIYGMLLLVLLVGSRASFRLISEFAQRQRQAGQRLVIYGAGDEGSIAVRYLMNDTRTPFRIIGFADDDYRMRNVRVHGYRVIGGHDHLVGMIMAREVDAVAVMHEDAGTANLAWLCGQYGVVLYRLAIDWQRISADAVAVGGGVALEAAEPRVVPFPIRRGQAPAPSRAAAAGDAAPIRVVHIITRLILGGAQENTLYTAIGQHQDPRFDVTLLCGIDEAGEGNMFAEANRAGVRTVVLPSLLREIRPLTDLTAVVGVYRFLRRGRYAIVHTHSSKAGVIGRIAARLAGVPVVVHTLHGLAFHEYQSAWKNRIYVALERLCAPLTDRLISVSDRVTEAALSHHVGRREQHQTIFSGIELDLFLSARERQSVEEAKERLGIPRDAPVVGKVARMFPLKGHEQFLAAAAEIARDMPGVYFLFVGDGPLREELRAEADRLGIGSRLVMTGRVPPETVPDYLQAMDVVVHTSLREGIARVLPQAGAVGKPVVTFHLDGAPEVIRDGVSGYLVPPVDTKAIAVRTVELLRDPERRRAFGEAGRAFAAEHFSVERMVQRISDVYGELLARRSSPLSASATRAGDPPPS